MKKGKRRVALLLSILMVFVLLPTSAFGAGATTQEMRGNVLHSLGLFAGTANGYQLHKSLTRMEAVTMIIHMMGEDQTAKTSHYVHPFQDVPGWAKEYAGYAYEKGISSGISAEKFGSSRICSQGEYLTFVLRALGYSDAKGDFEWNKPYALAKTVGLIDGETPLRRFSRGDMVEVSYRALTAKLAPQTATNHSGAGTDSTNGAGTTNGSGATNGAGATNGSGATDGSGAADGAGTADGSGTANGAGTANGSGTANGATTTGGTIAVVDSEGYHNLTLKDQLLAKGVFTAEQYALAVAKYEQGPKTEKAVYLTFDDGPSAKVTPRILNTLSEYGVPATFFVVGSAVEKNPGLVRRAYQEGHKVATHGYSHDYKYLYANTENLLSDIKKGNGALNQALGFDAKNQVFRFPGGSFGKKQVFKDKVKQAGYRYYDWNCSGEDATKRSGSTAKEIASSAVTTSVGKKGDLIVLFHDAGTKSTTADALPQVIKYFKDQGYVFRTLE